MNDYIYLDNNASTMVDPLVFEVIASELKDLPGNPSSSHLLGKKAKNKILQSKETIAKNLGVNPNEIVFTSGGTESLNMLIFGCIKAKGNGHIITTDIEHASVHKTILHLQCHGCDVSYIKTGLYGAATLDQVKNLVCPSTKLIVLSAVNSETGVMTDFEKIAEFATENNISFVIDGVALLGKKKFFLPKGPVAMGFSSHKIHGPKGAGFAYISSDMDISPIILGGPQENNLRAGTENLPGIVGTAKAVELAYHNLDENICKISSLRDEFENYLSKNLPIKINGEGPRICNTSNISFIGLDAEDLLIQLDLNKIMASHGSACQSNTHTLSRVLLNMGLSRDVARSAIRFSFSRMNFQEEIKKAATLIVDIVKRIY